MTEAEMVFDCYKKIKKDDKYKEVVLEVPYLSRSIDMVIVDHEDCIISIEFKLQNWKKALEQAKDHKLGSDKAYICMPEPANGFSPQFKDELINNGIGLFVYDKNYNYSLNEFIKPKIDTNKWLPRVESLQRLINKISNKQIFSLEFV